MVYRIYVEKKKKFADEAATLLSDIRSLLMIDTVSDLRLFNRYDVENIDEALFKKCEKTVFSEPQLDNTYAHLPQTDAIVFATEYLPGQFDQRADSCAQCIQFVSQGEKPLVRTAKVYMIFGKVTPAQLDAIKKYVINPVESREASLDRVETLNVPYDIPTEVETLDGFTSLSKAELADFVQKYALAMDNADIAFCQDYFKSEHRDPTITEIRMIDTYWSDHCRHTTFLTTIDGVEIHDPTVQKAYDRYVAIRKELGRTKPQNLMDLATIGARYLKYTGQLKNLDESGYKQRRTKRAFCSHHLKRTFVRVLLYNVCSNLASPFSIFHIGTAKCGKREGTGSGPLSSRFRYWLSGARPGCKPPPCGGWAQCPPSRW